MPLRMVSLPSQSGGAHVGESVSPAQLAQASADIRTSLGIAESFPPEVEAAAAEAAAHPQVPTEDLTDLPFFTVDPPGSTDLDQAMHLERTSSGYRVR